ncbi:hypothetical protein Pelo_13143 [Pelomyxa schiedti]|nr:hypothetical protein Pelo_13143 [Pelomyxa schiedti]
MSTPPAEDLIVKGWLVKLGAIHKTWKKRWFTNTASEPYILAYYTDETCRVKKGQVSLREVYSFRITVENKDKGDKQRTQISLSTHDRDWKMRADGDKAGELWTAGINKLMQQVVKERKKPDDPKPAGATTTTPATTTSTPSTTSTTPATTTPTPAPPTELYATAIASYTSTNSNELSFQRGDRLKIIDKEDQDGWWAAEFNGQRGWVSSFYVTLDTK